MRDAASPIGVSLWQEKGLRLPKLGLAGAMAMSSSHTPGICAKPLVRESTAVGASAAAAVARRDERAGHGRNICFSSIGKLVVKRSAC